MARVPTRRGVIPGISLSLRIHGRPVDEATAREGGASVTGGVAFIEQTSGQGFPLLETFPALGVVRVPGAFLGFGYRVLHARPISVKLDDSSRSLGVT